MQDQQKPPEQSDQVKTNVFTALPSAPAPLSEYQQSPKRHSLKKILLITLGVIVIIIGLIGAGILIVAFFIIGAFRDYGKDCSTGRTNLFASEQTLTREFNALRFIPDQPDVKASVNKQEGDCVDSLPMITETKSYDIKLTAGVAYDEINNTLVRAGYTASRNSTYAPDNPCKYQGKSYKFVKAQTDQEIAIEITCAHLSAIGEDWRLIPVTHAIATLTVEWKPVAN